MPFTTLIRYRYTHNDQPMTACPECGLLLTGDGSVSVHVAIPLDDEGWNFEETDFLSRLDDGFLYDPNGHVAAGHHSATHCARCDGLLMDMDGVHEEQRNEKQLAIVLPADIDWAQIRRDKTALIALLRKADTGSATLPRSVIPHLDGIVATLDVFQDAAAVVLGAATVFGKEKDK